MRRTRSVKLAIKDTAGLEACRDRLAAAIDDPDLLQYLAANVREFRMVEAALAARPGRVEGDDLAELRRRREARRSG